MGLFDNEDAAQAQREIEAKNEEIAELQRELRQSKLAIAKETSKVAAGDTDLPAMEVRQVTIKLPTFSESNLELWFGQAESQFILRGIKDDTTKFHHIYALLTEKASNEIEDLLLNPPKTGKVQAMKERLIHKFGRSQFSRDTELLSQRSLGDLLPSEMWSRFKRLNKDPHNHTSSFVRAYLIGMYPADVRTAIANMTFANNEEMARAADKILDLRAPKGVNAVGLGCEEEEAPEIDAVYRGTGAPRGRGNAKSSRGQGQGQGHQGHPGGSAKTSKTCFFHDRHGMAAFKCGGAPCPFVNLPLAAKAGNATAGR